MSIEPRTITVNQAIQLCNTLFADLTLFVEGEVANFTVSRGQFVFFDLKDENQDSRLSCFMMMHTLSVPLEDGMRVVVQARPGIFPKSGKFSLTVTKITPQGEGSLKRAFELLKQKLEKEGLFEEERKRVLPRYPEHIGVISSVDAAGYGDFMRVAESRFKGIQFKVAHVAVQGKDAEEEICYAFDYLNSQYSLDAIVLIRGGGSMEDLHAFNSELVARAIVRSKTPVLVGVGHERDVTIVDFVADVRASTPSNAAQLLLMSDIELQSEVTARLQGGERLLRQKVNQMRQQVLTLTQIFKEKISTTLIGKRKQVEGLLRTITAISPQATLERGYSITCREDGTPVRSEKDLKANTRIITTVSDGEFISVTQ